jgi:hypothetical protein
MSLFSIEEREEHRALTIRALEQLIGDDFIRATNAFRGRDLTEQHGQSGKTRQQVLDDYAAHDRRIRRAIEWVRSAK